MTNFVGQLVSTSSSFSIKPGKMIPRLAIMELSAGNPIYFILTGPFFLLSCTHRPKFYDLLRSTVNGGRTHPPKNSPKSFGPYIILLKLLGIYLFLGFPVFKNSSTAKVERAINSP